MAAALQINNDLMIASHGLWSRLTEVKEEGGAEAMEKSLELNVFWSRCDVLWTPMEVQIFLGWRCDSSASDIGRAAEVLNEHRSGGAGTFFGMSTEP